MATRAREEIVRQDQEVMAELRQEMTDSNNAVLEAAVER